MSCFKYDENLFVAPRGFTGSMIERIKVTTRTAVEAAKVAEIISIAESNFAQLSRTRDLGMTRQEYVASVLVTQGVRPEVNEDEEVLL